MKDHTIPFKVARSPDRKVNGRLKIFFASGTITHSRPHETGIAVALTETENNPSMHAHLPLLPPHIDAFSTGEPLDVLLSDTIPICALGARTKGGVVIADQSHCLAHPESLRYNYNVEQARRVLYA